MSSLRVADGTDLSGLLHSEDPFQKKYCRVGRHMVDVGHFHADASKKDGLCEWCKTCSNLKKRDWRRRNQDKERDIRNRARAREAGVSFEVVDYDAVRERDGHTCYLCGFGVQPHSKQEVFDHKVPLHRGGNHTQDNVGLAHARCNGRKGTKSVDELKWVVRWA